MPVPQHIGQIVRFHRQESGLTQKQLADLAGVGVSSVYAIERGRETVQMDTLLKILSVLSITLSVEGPLMKAFENRAAGQNTTHDAGAEPAEKKP
jgi:HTH-type transcriptional regulator/antitoxin HipB